MLVREMPSRSASATPASKLTIALAALPRSRWSVPAIFFTAAIMFSNAALVDDFSSFGSSVTCRAWLIEKFFDRIVKIILDQVEERRAPRLLRICLANSMKDCSRG